MPLQSFPAPDTEQQAGAERLDLDETLSRNEGVRCSRIPLNVERRLNGTPYIACEVDPFRSTCCDELTAS